MHAGRTCSTVRSLLAGCQSDVLPTYFCVRWRDVERKKPKRFVRIVVVGKDCTFRVTFVVGFERRCITIRRNPLGSNGLEKFLLEVVVDEGTRKIAKFSHKVLKVCQGGALL